MIRPTVKIGATKVALFLHLFTSLVDADDIFELPKGLTEQEIQRLDQIYEMGRDTDPPALPIRNIAEFEPMQGVLIRYPFGISTEIISELSDDVTIFCLVSIELQDIANSTMASGSVNMDNVEYILGSTDSYWTRDYGPWWIVNADREVSIVDFTYNRPRPNDNDAPLKIANHLNVPYYAVDIIHAGGNYMTDGLGIAASSDLVYQENNIPDESLNNLMEQYYGIQTYHVIDDPNNTYIDHIDCWGKYLSHTKVLIREVPNTHPQYSQIEETAQYFASTLNKWGEPWEVYRIYTPNDEPYTNSLMVNDKVLVPLYGGSWDDDALQTYIEALPGYDVMGFSGTWQSTDALHCRIKGIPDTQMLQISHNPLNDGASPDGVHFTISSNIEDLSNSGLIQDSLKVYWRHSTSDIWQSGPLDQFSNSDTHEEWIGYIPALTNEETIEYFITAADGSGRYEKNPPAGWHSFLAGRTEICDTWLNGDLDNSGQIDVIDVLLLTDLMDAAIDGICISSVSDLNDDSQLTYFDVYTLANQIIFGS